MTKIIHVALLALVTLTVGAIAGCGLFDDSQTLIAKSQEYRQKGDYKAAIIELKNVLQKNPKHAEARYLLGVAYNEIGDFRSAENELRRAIDLGYDQGKVIPALGKSLLLMGDFRKVLDEVRVEGNVGDEVRAEILTLRARAALGLGRQNDARELLEQALAKRPDFSDALLGQARLAATAGKRDDAARLIERAIASEPKNAEAWLMKGDLARISDDRAGAAAAYGKALEASPNNIPANVRARVNIASLYLAQGKLDEASKEIAQVRKMVPNSPLAHYMQALLEFKRKNFPAARDSVQQVLRVAPDHMPSLLLAGALEYALGLQGQAQAHLSRVLANSPGNLYARKLLISSLAKTGQLQRAIEILQPGLNQSPDDGALLALAGQLYIQNNDLTKASEYLEKAARANPKSAPVRTQLALSRLGSGDTEGAIADLESAIEIETPGMHQADILLVLTHLRHHNYDQALKALQSLEKNEPNNPLTYNLKAAVFIGKKDTPTARKYLERALELQPMYLPAAVNLAQLDLQDKNPKAARRRLEAILEKDKDNTQVLLALANIGPRIGATMKEQVDWLERASAASPKSPQPQILLARAYARAGDVKKALTTAQKAQAMSPENPDVLDTLGAMLVLAGQRGLALTTYEKLVSLRPKSPLALFHLAEAQAVNANKTAAADTLRRALSLKPDFVDAQSMLFGLELRAGHYPEAMKIARQVQKQTASSALGFALEGDVLMAEKKFLQAAKAYETAQGMRKNRVFVIKLHAAYARAGKAEVGDARLAQWLKESPDDGFVRLYAANSDLERGRYKEAITQYEWLQEKQPDNVLVLNNLAVAYQRVKDKRALETAERAYKLKPDNVRVADTLGWMLIENGDMKRGLELLQKAVTAAPGEPEIRYHLAQALLKSGDKSKARSELEQLVSADAKFPQRPEAQKLLDQLRK